MNSPTHENIDQWLFDFIEGNLSDAQIEELHVFLLLNPEYEADLKAWENSRVDFPIIDSELVSSYNFGVREENKKRKKRPFAFWIFPITLGVISLIGLTYLGADSIATPKNNVQKKYSEKLKSSNLIYNNYSSNKNAHKSYAHGNSANQNIWMNSSALTNMFYSLNNFKTAPAFLASNQSFEIAESSPFTSNRIDSFRLNIPKLNIINNNQLSDLSFHTNEQSVKRKVAISLPSLHISKNSVVGKYFRTESSSATLKDRVYSLQEKSHLDISEAFAGNRSQTRFQSMTTARWMGTGNQKLSQQISIDGYSRNLRSGFGVVANYSDFASSTIQDWNVRLIYSPKVALGRFILFEPSISYIVGQKSINSSKATNLSMFEYQSNQLQQFNYDLTKPIGKALYYRDLNVGVNMNLGPVFAGVNTQNILKHQDNIHTNNFETIDRANQQTNLYIGTDFSAKKGKIMFSPMLLHSMLQDRQFTQIGATIQLNQVIIGGNYCSNSSFGFSLGYQSKNFLIMTQSFKTKPLTSIEPQLMHQLTIRFNTNISRKTRRYLYL